MIIILSQSNTHDPLNLHSISPSLIPLKPLPLRHPATLQAIERNQTIEDRARAVLDGFRVAAHFQEVFAVGAAMRLEFGAVFDVGADQAGAEGAEGHIGDARFGILVLLGVSRALVESGRSL